MAIPINTMMAIIADLPTPLIPPKIICSTTEYHLSGAGQQWRAAYMLGEDVGAADYSAYKGTAKSSLVTSGIVDQNL